jgi:hypothetical protein
LNKAALLDSSIMHEPKELRDKVPFLLNLFREW